MKTLEKTCPISLSDRLDTYFHREGRKNNLFYRFIYSSMSSSGNVYIFLSQSEESTSIVISTINNKEDWRKVTTKITTDDPRVEEFIKPICLQYEKEMFDYYADTIN